MGMYLNSFKCSLFILFCSFPLFLNARQENQLTTARDVAKPVCFVENNGQLTDQYNHKRNDIQFKLATPGATLFVGNGRLHYQFKHITGNSVESASLSTYRMDVTLVGANRQAAVVASEPQPYYEQYYTSFTDNTGICAHAYDRIVYKEVYPGIDWVLYVKNNQVEYDFVVHPGGNPADIRLKYDGADKLCLTKDGSLEATTPTGLIREKTPFAYETTTGKAVATKFSLQKNIVCFHTGDFKGSLTIDPQLFWSTYLGGTGEDVATSVATTADATRSSYVGGYSSSTTIATVGSFHNTYGGGAYDAFLAKYSNTGAVQYITYFGGTGSDQGYAVALDNSGSNVYLAGNTTSPAFGLTTPGAYQGVNNGTTDGFLIKFNAAGARQWCTFFGGVAQDYIYGVTVDVFNNVIITGQTASPAMIATGGAYQTVLGGTFDAFLAKFNNAGGLQWSTYFGGLGIEQATGVTTDFVGDIMFTGQTNSSSAIATATAYQPALNGASDAFVAQFNTSGARIWATYFGGAATEIANGIACDASGNIAIIGNTTSTTGLATANVFQGAYGGVQDAFAAYFGNGGALSWSSYYGGAAADYGQGICFDANGNVVLTGGTFSSGNIATANSFQPAIGGDYDAFIAKVNPLGQTIWNSYFGGTFYDYANAIAADANGQLVAAGYTTSTGLYGAGGIATASGAQPANGGGVYDALITKFAIDTFVILPQPFTDTLICTGGSLNVPYTVYPAGATFKPGNVFTVQLSNSLGSFAIPTIIGTAVAAGSGAINCTIPGTVSGTGYRIRIVATSPAYTSPDDYYNIDVVSSIGVTTATANTPVCVAGNLSLNDVAPFTTSGWSWTGPAGSGFSSMLQNPVISGVTLANAGTYSVTVTHNGCPSSVSTVNVVVNSTIPPTPSTTNVAACAGNTVTLTALSDTTAPGITYNWISPTGMSYSTQTLVITGATAADTGTYFIQDTLAGCPSLFNTAHVTIHPVIPVTSSISATPGAAGAMGDTICLGKLVTFTASVSNGGTSPIYQWYAGSIPVVGAVSGTWSSASLVNGENVYCVINSSVLCPSPANAFSNTITMNVITNSPLAYITASPAAHVAPHANVTFTSTVYDGGINPRYQWLRNGMAIVGATNATWIDSNITGADSITLSVTSTMECPVPDSVALSNLVVAETNVGVTNLSGNLQAIRLYPNPNNGAFTIAGDMPGNSPVSVTISNLVGQLLYNETITLSGNHLAKTFDMGNLPGGVYLVRIVQGSSAVIIRFSKD